uniref:Uncharacterized protein n=1 Tax=Arundo donax TaxID=35708 RepID=A0A0A9F2A4_ARUDO
MGGRTTDRTGEVERSVEGCWRVLHRGHAPSGASCSVGRGRRCRGQARTCCRHQRLPARRPRQPRLDVGST